MSGPRLISLRAGERVFINGAVLKVDRRVSIELLNEAAVVLEQHILQPEDTTTPLRQLYFVLQTIVMDAENSDAARRMFEVTHVSLLLAFSNERVLKGLLDVKTLVHRGRLLEALKTVRELFPIEDEIMGSGEVAEPKLLEAV
jgi:flagellar protein FlbT